MQLMTLGPRGYKQVLATASATFTALQDRAAIIHKLLVVNPSANDNWTVTIQQTQKWNIPILTTGNQQILGKLEAANIGRRNIFDFCRDYLNTPLWFPLPQGQQLTIASAGGATADIMIVYEERSIGDVREDMPNGQAATSNIVPIFLTPGVFSQASGVALGDYDGQFAPVGFPKLYGDINVPANYTLTLLALFLESGGVNTFSGSANHQSVTDMFLCTYSGQQLFSRDANGGIPCYGQPSAAGSANNVYLGDLEAFPPFQIFKDAESAVLSTPLVFRGGSDVHFQLSTTGDATGNADYDPFHALLLFKSDYQYIAPV